MYSTPNAAAWVAVLTLFVSGMLWLKVSKRAALWAAYVGGSIVCVALFSWGILMPTDQHDAELHERLQFLGNLPPFVWGIPMLYGMLRQKMPLIVLPLVSIGVGIVGVVAINAIEVPAIGPISLWHVFLAALAGAAGYWFWRRRSRSRLQRRPARR